MSESYYEEPGFFTGLVRITDPINNHRMMGVARVDLADRDMDFYTLGPNEPVGRFALAPGGRKAWALYSEVGRYEFWAIDLEQRRVTHREIFDGRPRMGLVASTNGELKLLVDLALLGRDVGALVRIVGAFVAITVLSFIMNVTSGMRYTRVSADILFDMRRTLYEHLQTLSPRFYARTSLGEIVSRINSDIGEIQRIASETALAWIGNVLFLVGTVAMLLWLDARLFLVSLLIEVVLLRWTVRGQS